MNRGESRPRLVVDLRHTGLAGIRADGDRIHVGAMCSYSDLLGSDLVSRELPLLTLMAAGVTGGRQIQNQGTIGGSVVAARPQSDAPASVVALGGEAVIGGPEGERRCPPAGLFAGAMHTGLAPGRDPPSLRVSPRGRGGGGYYKLKRSASSWPIATAACLLRTDAEGRCSSVTLVLGAVAPTPVSVDLSGRSSGGRLSEGAVAEAGEAGRRGGARALGATCSRPPSTAPPWRRSSPAARSRPLGLARGKGPGDERRASRADAHAERGGANRARSIRGCCSSRPCASRSG